MKQSTELTQLSAALLEVLSRRSPRDENELSNEITHLTGTTQFSISALCQDAEINGWIEKHAYGWTLSNPGAQIYLDWGGANHTEEEDVGSSDQPMKPYDVAKLKVEQRQLSIFQALRKIEKNEIVLDPEFQRAFVWDDIRQSRLIESILVRIPLPAFYIDATDQVRWSVVDGLQRLTTLYRFCREESFHLKGLEFLTELSGLKFSELPQKYQVLIEDDTQLIFNNLLPGTPIKAKFTIFSRVNTGGMQLTAQEIRHALQQGPITKLLRTLTTCNEFLTSTGGALESLRMTDREVALRAISFMAFGYVGYKEYGDLDAFLVASMERFNSEYNADMLEELAINFKESLLKVYAIFGRYSFRKYYERGGRRCPFNKALFESWVRGVHGYSIEELRARKIEIQNEFLKYMNFNDSYLKSITASTGQYSAVANRFKMVEKIIEDAISDK